MLKYKSRLLKMKYTLTLQYTIYIFIKYNKAKIKVTIFFFVQPILQNLIKYSRDVLFLKILDILIK